MGHRSPRNEHQEEGWQVRENPEGRITHGPAEAGLQHMSQEARPSCGTALPQPPLQRVQTRVRPDPRGGGPPSGEPDSSLLKVRVTPYSPFKATRSPGSALLHPASPKRRPHVLTPLEASDLVTLHDRKCVLLDHPGGGLAVGPRRRKCPAGPLSSRQVDGVGEDGGYLPHRVGVRGAGNGLNHELQTVKGGHVPTT